MIGSRAVGALFTTARGLTFASCGSATLKQQDAAPDVPGASSPNPDGTTVSASTVRTLAK